MGVSMIKSWLPGPWTGSALPNSREDQRGSVTLCLYLAPTCIPNTPTMTERIG